MQRNRNRPGYRETKVGWIPEDWICSTYGQVFITIMDGTHYSPKTTTGPKKYITSRNIRRGELDLADCSYISIEEHKEIYRKCPVREGQVLLTKDGANAGNACLNPLQEEFSLLSSVAVLDADSNILSNRYAIQWILSPRGQHGLVSTITGQAITRFTLETIASVLIPLPLLPEQEAIAGVLECWDKAIQGYERKIEKKRNIKKGLMQRLLSGKQRLPGFSGEWKKERLEKGVIKFIVPMRDKPKKFCGTVPWCRIDDFDGKYLSICKSNKYVDQETILNMNLKIHPKETVLVSCSANIGICAIVKAPIITNQTFIGLVTNTLILNNEYLYYQMTYRAKQLNSIANGTTISYLSRNEFERFVIPFPSLPEQHAIASVLSSVDSEIKALEKKLAVLRGQKKYLLTNLVTGTIRLPEFRKDEDVK